MASNHFDADGNAHMVNVSEKQSTRRIAVAESTVRMSQLAAKTIRQQTASKGDVLGVARIAAIGATKWTAHLIPLCHSIPIESTAVTFSWESEAESDPQWLRCEVTCVTTGKTGIEMEALTGASVGALTVYDMLKSVDRAMEIGPTRLIQKSGGASGDFTR